MFLAVCLAGCSERDAGGESLLRIEKIGDERKDGYVRVIVMNPWKQGQTLHTYLLVPRGRDLPDGLPDGTVVRTPLRNVMVYSDVYARPIAELGCAASIGSVCDAQFFKTPEIVGGVADGRIADCGSSMSPSAELIVSASPEAIILSPMENSGYGVLENMGIPIIEMADYMESSPLSRAKWIEFIGLLYGKETEAAAIYETAVKEYGELKAVAETAGQRPSVISETVTGGVWYVPGGKSYKAQMFQDAGAAYPWADNASKGSLSLDFPRVLDKAQNADYWLVTVYGYKLTAESMLGLYPHNDRFRAFGSGGVYYIDSSESALFEETAFHPERLLKEYIKLFHPQLLPDYRLRYYRKMGE